MVVKFPRIKFIVSRQVSRVLLSDKLLKFTFFVIGPFGLWKIYELLEPVYQTIKAKGWFG